MTISWLSKLMNSKPEIKYGTSPTNMILHSTGYSTSYNFTYPEYGIYESGKIHHVSIQNLLPSNTYYYQCGDFSLLDVSTIRIFETLPSIGSQSEPLVFGVIGDLGQTTDSLATLQHVLDNKSIKMILHPGDLSYADCQQPLWDSYGKMIEPLASRIPWMVGPGNHEIELNADGSLYLAFEERYKMPSIKPAEYGKITISAKKKSDGMPHCCSSVFQSEYNYGNSFYSFEAGLAHIIYLNPYSTSDEKSRQYKWLVEDFLMVNREKTPWIIVVMHCPWYSSNKDHYEEEQTVLMRESMEHLFHKNRVNLVLNGHVHAYERTFPVYKNDLKDAGIVYITIGDGGNLEGHANEYYDQPKWSAFRNGTQYGHGELNILNSTTLEWRWLRNIDGEIVFKDSYMMQNSFYL
jgi:UDP-2,3-diacylglucosamine pyrophosphatase LpxH